MTDPGDEHEPYGFTESPVIASIDLGDLVALQAAIARLTAERDEARREIAHRVFVSGGLRPAQLAESRGWDCFKEDGK
jgi:hypothetical protein